jgi:hypothetical protein
MQCETYNPANTTNQMTAPRTAITSQMQRIQQWLLELLVMGTTSRIRQQVAEESTHKEHTCKTRPQNSSTLLVRLYAIQERKRT